MNSNAKLETYLTTLEQVLKPFSVSDRAEIVMEIKSHVLSALERDSQATTDSVLNAMGPAEIVANRYLMERGLKPTKPSISPIVRWLVFGFLGTCALLALVMSFAIVKLSPLIKVDEQKGRVILLGGLIDIQSTQDTNTSDNAVLSIAGVQFKEPLKGITSQEYSGSTEVKDSQEIHLLFNNGKLDVQGTSGTTLTWNCTIQKQDRKPYIQTLGATLQLDLRDWSGIDCSIQVPKQKLLKIRGNNGWIEFSGITTSVDTKLTNGNIEFNPENGTHYTYDVSVQTGMRDAFETVKLPPGTKSVFVRLSVINGKISQ